MQPAGVFVCVCVKFNFGVGRAGRGWGLEGGKRKRKTERVTLQRASLVPIR